MRAYKRYDRRGFTLVELMIVVAIIGVLAALAIYGVRRYLASAKTSEAKNTVGAISRGAAAAFERETTASQMVAEGTASTASSHALCDSTGINAPLHGTVPNAIGLVSGTKYQPVTAEGSDFETGTSLGGWKCLKFSMTQPIYYMYSYNKAGGFVSNGLPGAPALTADSFEAAAQGNLDNDAAYSTFARGGTVNTATGQLVLATQVYTNDEYE